MNNWSFMTIQCSMLGKDALLASPSPPKNMMYQFATFQCWLQLVVFHLKGDFLSNLALILIILNLSLWVLSYTVKLWNVHFWTTLVYSFTYYQRKFNLRKSSLWICHLGVIKMYRKLDRKSPFTSAATWWSSTLESGEL